ncbi:Vacuolar protein sorting-associated protein 17 [Dimargaris xerosporica]|nr:Vacuolar protein sorting-associated protein 17 [Dimargaris xerosporica]
MSVPDGRQPTMASPALTFKIVHVDRSKRSPIYRFDVMTTLPNFKRKRYLAVERSYLELEKLRQHLVQTYPECLIPVLPAATAHTPTSLGSGNNATLVPLDGQGPTKTFNTTSYEEDALVREAIQIFLHRIVSQPILRNDYELREFVETPFAFNPATIHSGYLPVHSSFLSFGSSRRSRTNFQSQVDPSRRLMDCTVGSDEWYSVFGAQMVSFEDHLAPMRKSAARVARKRKVLAELLQDFAAKNVALSVTEPNEELSLTLRQTGNWLHRVSDVQRIQAEHESMRFDYFLDQYARSTETVLDAIVSRQQIYCEYDATAKRAERKKQNIMVLKSSSSIHSDRADQALDDFEQAKNDQSAKLQLIERVNSILPKDLDNFEAHRELDFTHWLKVIAKRQLEFEKQQFVEWNRLRQQLSHSSTVTQRLQPTTPQQLTATR